MATMTIAELRRLLQPDPAAPERKHVTIDGFHHAGVLVPIVNQHAIPNLLLTKRTEAVETHKGQISFPGGMVDSTDEDIAKTALREAEEELGLSPAAVELLGLLDDHPTPTGFVITPVIGIIESLPPLKPNPVEVAEVLLVPLDFFADQRNARSELREFRGRRHEVWFYQFGEHLIWGATAMITRSLLKRLRLLE
jgi:8-oxo-dGTP pyrophosphatase MutT (NUDIX family)